MRSNLTHFLSSHLLLLFLFFFNSCFFDGCVLGTLDFTGSAATHIRLRARLLVRRLRVCVFLCNGHCGTAVMDGVLCCSSGGH